MLPSKPSKTVQTLFTIGKYMMCKPKHSINRKFKYDIHYDYLKYRTKLRLVNEIYDTVIWYNGNSIKPYLIGSLSMIYTMIIWNIEQNYDQLTRCADIHAHRLRCLQTIPLFLSSSTRNRETNCFTILLEIAYFFQLAGNNTSLLFCLCRNRETLCFTNWHY